MPFNPFSSFRKYQKFWMATILLVCMVTFVLCTGVGGDLSDRILGWFGRRSGNAMAKLDGRTIYSSELHDLKEQRMLAERVTRKAFEVLDRQLGDFLKELAKKPNTSKEEQFQRGEAELIQRDIQRRLAKKFYWDSGTKLEELVDFIMWRNLADRLNVDLVSQSVTDMFYEEIFHNPPRFMSDRHLDEIFIEARGSHRGVTWGTIMAALRDEFRVRIAKLAYAQAQVEAYQDRKVKEVLHLKLHYPVETRAPVTPHELWDFYRKNRTEYDVSLVPVSANYFVDRVAKADKKEIEALLKDAKFADAYKVLVNGPSKAELTSFYNERRLTPYDPSSPVNGLQTPQQVKVEYLVGDPQEEFYQRPAKALALTRNFPPAWVPTSLVATAVRYAAVPAITDKLIDEFLLEMGLSFVDAKLSAKTDEQLAVFKFVKRRFPPIVNLLGPPGQPFGTVVLYHAATRTLNPERLEREDRNRMLMALAPLASLQPKPMPLSLKDMYEIWKPAVPVQTRQDMEKQVVDRIATDAVQHNMQLARTALERVKHNAESTKNRIEGLKIQYGLVRYSTPRFYDRFEIDKAPELTVLKEAYKRHYVEVNIFEGRGGTPGVLKEDQLYRLFFDNEPFAASAREYFVRPWPPDVTARPSTRLRTSDDDEFVEDRATRQRVEEQKGKVIQLFAESPKPILFWKTEDILPSYPPAVELDKLDPVVRKRAEDLYKLEKARDALALPTARDIAETMQKIAADNLPAAVREESAKLGVTPIPLPRVSQLERVGTPEMVRYRSYRFPRDKFEYARDEMSKELIALIEKEKKPVETGVKELDEINKTLFEKNKGLGKQIQIFTNKPRSTYYVGVVVSAPYPDKRDFVEAYKNVLGLRKNDDFVRRAHEELAKEYFEELTRQLRDQMGYDISLASAEDRKSFD